VSSCSAHLRPHPPLVHSYPITIFTLSPGLLSTDLLVARNYPYLKSLLKSARFSLHVVLVDKISKSKNIKIEPLILVLTFLKPVSSYEGRRNK
jgi:hypothetical protein